MVWLIVQSLINGVFSGTIYSLIAVGITIVFGVMRMVNFASGAYLMLGMYYTYFSYMIFAQENYVLIPLVIIIALVVSYISFVVFIKPVLKKERMVAIIVTMGLSYLLQNLVILIFGAIPLTVPSVIKSSVINFGDFSFSVPRFIAFVAAIVLTLIVTFALDKTSFGRQMRATAESAEIAEMLGIKTKRIFTWAWAIGIVLTAIAGCLITPMYMVDSSVGTLFRSAGLMAVVLGGLGSIKGAFIGGILLGIAESLIATLVDTNLGPVGMFVFFLVMLYFLPNGMFGKGERAA